MRQLMVISMMTFVIFLSAGDEDEGSDLEKEYRASLRDIPSTQVDPTEGPVGGENVEYPLIFQSVPPPGRGEKKRKRAETPPPAEGNHRKAKEQKTGAEILRELAEATSSVHGEQLDVSEGSSSSLVEFLGILAQSPIRATEEARRRAMDPPRFDDPRFAIKKNKK